MKTNLRVRKVADLYNGNTGKETPAWYEVDGLPAGLRALIESTGEPKPQWRITRIPCADQDKWRTFATVEDALELLQQEVG
jgi:hypothetical protein